MRIISDFSSETMQARRQWSEVFKVLSEKKNKQPRILCLAKLCFKNEDEFKTSSTNKNWGNLFPEDLSCNKCLKKFIQEKKKIVEVRSMDLHQVRESTEEGRSESLKKALFFLFLM